MRLCKRSGVRKIRKLWEIQIINLTKTNLMVLVKSVKLRVLTQSLEYLHLSMQINADALSYVLNVHFNI